MFKDTENNIINIIQPSTNEIIIEERQKIYYNNNRQSVKGIIIKKQRYLHLNIKFQTIFELNWNKNKRKNE